MHANRVSAIRLFVFQSKERPPVGPIRVGPLSAVGIASGYARLVGVEARFQPQVQADEF